jgi:hypothetical protein
VRSGRRGAVAEAAGAEDGQLALDEAQPVGAHREAAHGDAHDVAVTEDARAHVAGDLLELVLPALGVGVRDVQLADHAVQQQVQELVLARHVPVEGGRAGVELGREAAHRQRVEPLAVEHRQRGLDDLLARERRSPGPSRRPRGRRPGRGGDACSVVVRHANNVPIANTVCNPGGHGL